MRSGRVETTVIRLDKTLLIERPVDEVFGFVADFENEATWCEEVVSTEKTSHGTLGVGSTFTDHVQFLGRTMKSSYEIVAYEPDRAVTVETTSGPVPFRATYSVEDAGRVTRLAFSATAEPGTFFAWATPLIRRRLSRQWDRNLANLKRLLER
jgi:carbon monoxide dehydrogenase subunit G